ncbi:MAG TPA: hypothetical protein VLB80_00525 [Candidatus Babeliales bacterium]|nr:hypothetical protein [Candidatus Babeliales bacterium]
MNIFIVIIMVCTTFYATAMNVIKVTPQDWEKMEKLIKELDKKEIIVVEEEKHCTIHPLYPVPFIEKKILYTEVKKKSSKNKII